MFIAIHPTGCAHKKRPSQAIHHVDPLAMADYHASFDANPSQKPVSYLYAPGLMCTELFMARYCPRFTASTGEKITNARGGHVIGQPHSAVIFPEIDLKTNNGFTFNPLTALMNNIRHDLFPLATRLFQDKFGIVSTHTDQSACQSVINYGINFSAMNIGQKNDINALHKAYRKHKEQHPHTDIILYGDSRGAATIFNFIALHRPSNVKAAVLEGIFDDVSHMVRHFLYADKEVCTEHRLLWIVALLARKYKPTGMSPRLSVEKITDEIPILFVISRRDEICAPQGTLYLYNKLKARGHRKIHLLMLDNTSHVKYMIGPDKSNYENVVHAFYRHYQLPHNSKKANKGHALFMQTQPRDVSAAGYNLEACSACS